MTAALGGEAGMAALRLPLDLLRCLRGADDEGPRPRAHGVQGGAQGAHDPKPYTLSPAPQTPNPTPSP